MKTSIFVLIFFLSFSQLCIAQGENKSDVHLFQTFSRDAAVSDVTYGQAMFSFSDYDPFSFINFGIMAGFPINKQFEISGGLAFLNVDRPGGAEAGFSDLRVNGKYHFESSGATRFSAGATLTLPIGTEDVGQGEANFGIFGAMRHPLSSRTVLMAVLGIDFIERRFFGDGGWPALTAFSVDTETSLYLGGGVIQQLNEKLHLVGELNFATEGDYAMLSGGLDYELQSGRLRGLLGLGLNDGAPDIALVIGYLMTF